MRNPYVQLRDLTLDDVEDRYRWTLDTEVTKYLNVPDHYPPFTKEETEKWVTASMSRQNGAVQKAIVTEEGHHIGWVELKNFDKANGSAELGIAIGDRSYWGKGYGTSALTEMLILGFDKFNLYKIWVRVDIDNEAAIRAYKRTGFIEEGMMDQVRVRKGVFIDRLKMGILKVQFRKRQPADVEKSM